MRVWPSPARARWLSFDAYLGNAEVSEAYDCFPGTTSCAGGAANGSSWGAAVRAAVARGRLVSLDVSLRAGHVRWRDATTHDRNSAGMVGLGLGLSFD